MKVLLVNGSPHAAGSTYTALHEMEQIFQANGIETELLQTEQDTGLYSLQCLFKARQMRIF